MTATSRRIAHSIISAAAGVLAVMVLCGCQLPEMPSRDAVGGLKLVLDPDLQAPVTHVPVEHWRTHHREAINRGEFPEAECQKCHDPDTYCNNCHTYVGVRRIEKAAEAATAFSVSSGEVGGSGD